MSPKKKRKSSAKTPKTQKVQKAKSAESEHRAEPKREKKDATRANDGTFGRYAPWAALGAIILGIVLWQTFPTTNASAIPEDLMLRVVESRPHDPEAFTQGLVFHDGHLYESTGLRGQSTLRRVNVETGEVERQVELDEQYFAEGLAVVDDRLIQLTWRAGVALVYDIDTLEKIDEHEYTGEGWGLCYDGERLVMTSGNDRLQFRDPQTFEKLGEVRVARAGRPLRRLNELECVDGVVYANVWMDDHIARIDPETGRVTAWIDAGDLLPRDARHGGEDVLNGIAYLPDSGHFLLTGKNWSRIFEVELVEREREP
jgi:glutaminyl-peptide cyclotransferase